MIELHAMYEGFPYDGHYSEVIISGLSDMVSYLALATSGGFIDVWDTDNDRMEFVSPELDIITITYL